VGMAEPRWSFPLAPGNNSERVCAQAIPVNLKVSMGERLGSSA
jgi:hypothetical protein